MLMPSIFSNNSLFDDFFNDSWFDDRDFKDVEKKLYGHRAKNVMNTDVKENENGYLTISASKGLDKDEKEKDTGKYIRRERYAGACQRSFYVGDAVSEEDIKASFKHGILKLQIPKKEAKKVENKNYIAIEG